jgi:DNA repair exonuclease SbcCD ATPase subunit
MMQLKPSLIVNRLVITKSGYHAYDETFKAGVNVIRGKNSSGKSTVADFLFYGLGGELTKWKNEAKSCDYVFVEVSLSGNTYTLKREVNEKSRTGMDIFSGTFEAALQSSVSGWLRYPYNANQKESFYQAILKELGIPYSKSDDKNSITMHQLLRMMYVDQMTSPDRLFKFDTFDSPNKRQAIGELLIGLSDFKLYESRVRLQKLVAQLESKIKEIKTIHRFFGDSIQTVEQIDDSIADKRKQIENIESELSDSQGVEDSTDSDYLIELKEKLTSLRKEHNVINDDISFNFLEVNDSKQFIDSLQLRLNALLETNKTINALSDIAFNFCPACHVEVTPKEAGCNLCGHCEHENDSDIDPTFKVRKEIEFQIAESSKLIELKQIKISELEVKSSQLAVAKESCTNELNSLIKPKTGISNNNRKLLLEIGSLNRQISEKNANKEKFAKLYSLYDQRESLQKEVNNLDDEIKRKEASLSSELNRKKYALANATLELLRADKDHEEIFLNGRNIEFDFAEDRVSIDERALFSASSMVYLKNSFRLAMLKASCTDKSYLYPRFLLMDNIEDKGMETSRSQLFQQEVVKMSQSLECEHQIIFTTSMIDPDINDSEYCVGEFYTDQNKTLKFK